MSGSNTSNLIYTGLNHLVDKHVGTDGKVDDMSALVRDFAADEWHLIGHLAYTELSDATPQDALSAAESLGRLGAPPQLIVSMGLVVPLLSKLSDSPEVQNLTAKLQDGLQIATEIPRLRRDGNDVQFQMADGFRREVLAQGTVLNGSARQVAFGGADVALVGTDEGSIAVIPCVATGVRTVRVGSVVPGVEIASLTCSGTKANHELLLLDDVADAVHRAGIVFSLLLDAYAVGIARRMIEVTVKHVSSRNQFGQPIGRFQSVQHTIANMQVAAETSHSLLMAASESWHANGDAALPEVVSSRLYSSSVASRVCESAIQLHGGMGFTWEAGLHRWYRIARLSEHMFTDEPGLRRFLIDEIRRNVHEGKAESHVSA